MLKDYFSSRNKLQQLFPLLRGCLPEAVPADVLALFNKKAEQIQNERQVQPAKLSPLTREVCLVHTMLQRKEREEFTNQERSTIHKGFF